VSQAVFRKVSLDRLSSPEQLDQVMRVTNPRGWIALGSLGLLLLTAIAWGFVGTLSEKVAGRGILVKSGGLFEVVSTASGRITDVSVGVGDSVTEGQVVAWVAQPELLDKLQQARENLALVRRENDQSLAFGRTDAELQRRGITEQRSNLEQSIAAAEASLRALGERVQSQEQLVRQGLLTRSNLLATQQQFDQTREKIRSSRADMAQLEVRRLSVEKQLEEASSTGGRKLHDAQEEVAQVERDLKQSSQIVSPYTGRILEVMTEQGKIVNRGEPVLSLDLTGRSVTDLVAVIYVPSVHGKKVHPGMPIQIAPSTVRQEEYGMMLGRVTFVSNFPATPRGMGRVLKNEQLVSELSGGGAPYEVHADLIVDPHTQSRYRWSSSGGPPVSIQSGTLAVGNIAVDTERPISTVIPLLRKWTGFQ
jgi:HlyD family secretion protein